jgi:predicted ATPase/Tfp pilus assembly protein PilF
VTFLFTDIEGSTRRWEEQRDSMPEDLARHDAILREAIERNGGYVFKLVGDAFCAAFPTAPQAVHAVVDAQRALHTAEWAGEGELKVRMALHTGVVEERENDYMGPLLNRLSRLLSAGYGGQVLLTRATAQLVSDNLPEGVRLKDMGEHRLRDLFRPEMVYQLDADRLGLPSDFPPLKTLDARPNNLPLQTTPLVGREDEVESVRSMVLRSDVRLLTLVGPGGVGKTRLALQAAADLLEEFPEGVFFVNLAPLIDPGLVIPSIAHTLGVREAGGQPIAGTLKEYLRDKEILLVLDNFEQVIEAAPEVAELLRAASQLKIISTSRAPLDLTMEHLYAVPPLQVPDPRKMPSIEALSQYESVELFIQVARASKHDFGVDNHNAASVAEICYRLEGIPLAIELAAARIKVLTPHALLERLGSRLKLLTGGARDLPGRQQTLRNTIEWSYNLLTEEDRQLFRRLAVFRGGCTLEAAEAVCNYEVSALRAESGGNKGATYNAIEVLDGITSLVSKNLMYVIEGPNSEPRYAMLESLREYAWEKLAEEGASKQGLPLGKGEVDLLQREHALYFLKLSEEAEPQLKGAGQVEWLARLEAERDNFRVALRWSQEKLGNEEIMASSGAGNPGYPSSVEIGLRIVGSLWRYWYVRGFFSEGREELAEALAQSGRASLPNEANLPELGAAQEAILRPYRAKALHGAAVLASLQGEYDSARRYDEEGLAIARELGDKESIPAFLDNLGIMARQRGDYASARSFYEESLALRREIGDKRGIAMSLDALGIISRQQGDFALGRSLYEESLALRREIGDKQGIAFALSNLGNAFQSEADLPRARSLLEESLALRREIGDKRGIAISLNNLGTVAQLQGNYAEAHTLLEEGLALVRELGDKQGIAYLLSTMANLSRWEGDYASARSLLKESLVLRREIGDKRGVAISLLGLGGVEAQSASSKVRNPTIQGPSPDLAAGRWQGVAERGVRLMGAGGLLIGAMGDVLDLGDRLPYEQSIASARAILSDEEFERANAAGRSMGMEQAIEYALEEV